MVGERRVKPADPRAFAATGLIAEDERFLRVDLERRLAALWPELTLLDSVGTGIDALTMFERHRPDVMFLDIQMPALNGLEVARMVGDACQVVFVTAFDAHAVAAFEHGAVDYVLKPYDNDRLSRSVERIRTRLGTPTPSLNEILRTLAAAVKPKSHLAWIKASHGSEVSLIMVSNVCYFRADAKYTSVVTAEREYIIRRSIKDLADELDPDMFWQIHRSTIVNVESIASVSRNLAGATILKLRSRPERLSVSEPFRHLFRHM